MLLDFRKAAYQLQLLYLEIPILIICSIATGKENRFLLEICHDSIAICKMAWENRDYACAHKILPLFYTLKFYNFVPKHSFNEMFTTSVVQLVWSTIRNSMK